MSDKIVSLAEQRELTEKEKKQKELMAKEERNKKIIPLSALIIVNIIFLSLDVRAFQAVYILTSNYLLAFFTVLISGGLALYWFDALLPHSRKHKNKTQIVLSSISTPLAVGLSAILAFADYVVGTGDTFSKTWSNVLWGTVIVLTVYQGCAVGYWYLVDNHIKAEAKISESHAELSDQEDDMFVLRNKLANMKAFLNEYEKMEKDFSPQAVKAVAKMVGIVLPSDNDPNSKGG